MNLNNDIIKILKQQGCNIVGFADLRCLSKEARRNFDYGIVIALPFSKEAMIENINSPQKYYEERRPMTQRLNKLREFTADYLTEKGYEVNANIPPFSADDKDNLTSILPLKTVATLSGIGWIGKCALLVTKEVGSAFRMTVVLTNAPVECGTSVTKSKCPPDCTVCVDICPGKAPLGGFWEAGIEREKFFDAHACYSVANARAKEKLGIDDSLCGLCMSNCPFTKRGLGYE
jgi:epoxyqueuosine reductase QueG